MNITEILKDAPKDTELYSPLLGVVTLKGVIEDACYAIEVIDKYGLKHLFTPDGRFYEIYKNAECLLFPSKVNRDWSTFKVGPQFPATYIDCLNTLGWEFCNQDVIGCYKDKLDALQELLICRDAWWLVDNNWRPDWSDHEQYKYYIDYHCSILRCDSCNLDSRILAFRTPEIRNKFLKAFRSLIEGCKELL